MTRTQKTLYSMLMAENKAAQNAGEPFLRNGKQTIGDITETISEEAAAAIVQELRDGSFNDSFQTHKENASDWNSDGSESREACRMEFLLWEIYLLDYSGIHWEAMQRALLDIAQQTGSFYLAAQNKITNALPGLFKTGLQMNVLGEATGTVGTRKSNEVNFILRNAGEHELRTTAKMLMDVLLIDFARTHSADVEIPIRQYAQMRGMKLTKSSLDTLTRQAAEDLDTLADIKAQYYENKRPSGHIELNGGTHIIHRGRILWNWNQHMLPTLEKLAPVDYSKETLMADPRTSTYYFSRYLDVNFRRNEGRDSVNKVYIATLLKLTPYIPDLDKLRAQRASVKNRAIIPFFRDLDAIERIYYDVYTADGQRVDDPLEMDADSFKNGYILVDYSDYEGHPERIENRKKRERKAQQARSTSRTNTRKINDLEARVKALENE